MSTHTYALSDFPNEKVAPRKLNTEVLGACGQETTSINVNGSQATLTFEPDLPAEQEANLDAVVAAHDGVERIVDFVAASEAIGLELQITEDATWQMLGGVVTNPLFFIPNSEEVIGRIVGQVKTQGVGVEIRLVEDGTEVQLNSNVFQAPDTAGAWQSFKFQTDTPPQSQDETLYRLEGRLNGATSASLRFTSMTLLRVFER